MNEIETELIMLGTGNATVTKCYNTCFILKTKETVLLVDAGGGKWNFKSVGKSGCAY
jgi:ribonuclease Z